MALDKKHYFAKGKESFLAGDASPVTTGTWQSRAFDDGYAAAMAEELDDMRREDAQKAQDEAALPKETLTESLTKAFEKAPLGNLTFTRVNYVKPAWMPNDAIIEHINFLRRTAATCSDMDRRFRLVAKANTLSDRWARRITNAPGSVR